MATETASEWLTVGHFINNRPYKYKFHHINFTNWKRNFFSISLDVQNNITVYYVSQISIQNDKISSQITSDIDDKFFSDAWCDWMIKTSKSLIVMQTFLYDKHKTHNDRTLLAIDSTGIYIYIYIRNRIRECCAWKEYAKPGQKQLVNEFQMNAVSKIINISLRDVCVF